MSFFVAILLCTLGLEAEGFSVNENVVTRVGYVKLAKPCETPRNPAKPPVRNRETSAKRAVKPLYGLVSHRGYGTAGRPQLKDLKLMFNCIKSCV